MKNADAAQEAKRLAGIEAAGLVESGFVVGLGTGSTAAFAIAELGRRIREEGLSIVGIPTSFSAAILAREGGVPLATLDDVDAVDLAIDGADEIDPQRNLIKGGGAAHTREKVIAAAAKRFIVVGDESKLVSRLGTKMPVPVEVIPMALAPALRRLRGLGAVPEIRMGIRKDGPVITDQGNLVVDARFDSIDDPSRLECAINEIPGVLDNGLFVGMAELVIVGSTDRPGVRRF
jgi:ribose 5-phosphate isomerase A